MTALHNAAGRGADTLVKLLLEKGAKLDAKDKLGRLPIDMARGVGGGGGAAAAPRARCMRAPLRCSVRR